MVDVRGISRRSIWALAPPSRRYQSLGSAIPSASSVRNEPVAGAWDAFSATLNIAVLSLASSNMATYSIVAPA